MVNVIHMLPEVLFIANLVFVKTALPNAFFMAGLFGWA